MITVILIYITVNYYKSNSFCKKIGFTIFKII